MSIINKCKYLHCLALGYELPGARTQFMTIFTNKDARSKKSEILHGYLKSIFKAMTESVIPDGCCKGTFVSWKISQTRVYTTNSSSTPRVEASPETGIHSRMRLHVVSEFTRVAVSMAPHRTHIPFVDCRNLS